MLEYFQSQLPWQLMIKEGDLIDFFLQYKRNFFTHCPLGNVAVILKLSFSNSFYTLISGALPVKMLSSHLWKINNASCNGLATSGITCSNVHPVLCHHTDLDTRPPLFNILRAERGFKLITAIRSDCLTHWGRVMHISVGKLTIIGSDNGLTPGGRQAIIRTNHGILLIWALGTNFSYSHIFIKENAFENLVCEMAAIFFSGSMCEHHPCSPTTALCWLHIHWSQDHSPTRPK